MFAIPAQAGTSQLAADCSPPENRLSPWILRSSRRMTVLLVRALGSRRDGSDAGGLRDFLLFPRVSLRDKSRSMAGAAPGLLPIQCNNSIRGMAIGLG